MEKLLNEREAAAVLNCSVQLLRKWRGLQAGPRPVRIGRCVRYSPEDLALFVAASRNPRCSPADQSLGSRS